MSGKTNPGNFIESDVDIGREDPPVTGRLRDGTTAAGYRIVHVAVPESVFNYAKAQAFLAGKTWTEYITDLLQGFEK